MGQGHSFRKPVWPGTGSSVPTAGRLQVWPPLALLRDALLTDLGKEWTLTCWTPGRLRLGSSWPCRRPDFALGPESGQPVSEALGPQLGWRREQPSAAGSTGHLCSLLTQETTHPRVPQANRMPPSHTAWWHVGGLARASEGAASTGTGRVPRPAPGAVSVTLRPDVSSLSCCLSLPVPGATPSPAISCWLRGCPGASAAPVPGQCLSAR